MEHKRSTEHKCTRGRYIKGEKCSYYEAQRGLSRGALLLEVDQQDKPEEESGTGRSLAPVKREGKVLSEQSGRVFGCGGALSPGITSHY